MASACITLMTSDSLMMLAVFFALFGCAGGMGQPLVNALLAERYGTKWLGEIKALASPLNVFPALSPAVLGILFDYGAGLNIVIALLLSLSCFSLLMPFLWFNILRRTQMRLLAFIQPAQNAVHAIEHPPDKRGNNRYRSRLKDFDISWQMAVRQEFQ